ncbi:MAG: type II toxin-antitoxin system VapC family toxin [Thermoleophilaceae bacterium]
MIAYLDSSALVKLIFPEGESPALARELAAWPNRASSVLARVEVLRTARLLDVAEGAAGALMRSLLLVPMDDRVLGAAAWLEPASVKSLDAIHVATALSLGDDLGAIFTYDRRMQEAAAEAGANVLAPA